MHDGGGVREAFVSNFATSSKGGGEDRMYAYPSGRRGVEASRRRSQLETGVREENRHVRVHPGEITVTVLRTVRRRRASRSRSV